MLINRVKIYVNPEVNLPKSVVKSSAQIDLEHTGNVQSNICCILNCSSPISESKDYKTLVNVFKKLMVKIDFVYVINIKDCESTNFIHYIHENGFKKFFIFGQDAMMSEVPIPFSINQISHYQSYKVLFSENLNKLVDSTDDQFKKETWEKIQEFYRS